MPTQYAIPAIVAAFILGFYVRSKFAGAGRLVDRLIADDPWDVQIGVDDAEISDVIARDFDCNGGAPTAWSDAVPPGGRVCAVPVIGMPDGIGICGVPVESEPCCEHVPDYEEAGPC